MMTRQLDNPGPRDPTQASGARWRPQDRLPNPDWHTAMATRAGRRTLTDSGWRCALSPGGREKALYHAGPQVDLDRPKPAACRGACFATRRVSGSDGASARLDRSDLSVTWARSW